jgi:TRAP transporter TAXI family solute receptor
MPSKGGINKMKTKGSGILIAMLALTVLVMSASTYASVTKAPKEVPIQLLALRFGTLGYTSTFGLADLINKHSSWLRATAVETKGTIINARTLAEEKAKRKNTVILNSLSVQDLAVNAKPPFKAPYDGLRAIALAYRVVGCFATLDPKIKDGKDLIGKRVGIGKKGSTSALWPETILKYGWEVWDELKSVQHLGYKGFYDALRGGTLDVVLFNNIFPGASAPATKEFMESVPAFYTVSVPPEIVNKARRDSGLPIYPGTMPAGALGPKQPEAYQGFTFTIGWWADKELPNDIAYEVARVIYDNIKDFWTYHAGLKGVTHETVVWAAGEEKDFHPGAIKLYREKGLKVGVK